MEAICDKCGAVYMVGVSKPSSLRCICRSKDFKLKE